MNIIRIKPSEIGLHAPIQTWDNPFSPPDYAEVAPSTDTSAMQTHNGFVALTIEDGVVTAIEPNLEAWEAWKASLPEPTPAPPTALEQLRADMDFIAIMTGVAL